MKSSVRPLLLPLSLIILWVAGVGQAFSHAHLVSSVPEANDMAMPSPTELRLKFSEGIELKFTKVQLTGPDKKTVETGPAKLEDRSTLIVPLIGKLPDGTYTVDWKAVSVDGHKSLGHYTFESMQ
jgi:methionine-rich copper-binding protein CopC